MLDTPSMTPFQTSTVAAKKHALPAREWILLPLLPLLAFLLSGMLELSEHLNRLTGAYETHQLDELPFALLTLALTLAWIAWSQRGKALGEIRRREQTECELDASRAKFLELSRRMTETLEDERRQIAHELHDEFGQVLNAIKLEAVAICNRSECRDPELARGAANIATLTDGVYSSVRQMLRRLRPVALDELGLPGALEHAVSEWRERMPGTTIALHVGELPPLPDAVAIVIFRMFQESLTNIVRHAHADQIRIKLGLSPDASRLLFVVSDNGSGAKPDQITRGLGLVGMKERIESLAGTLTVQCAPNGGFSVAASIPVATAPDQDTRS